MLAEIVWDKNTLGVIGAFSIPIVAIVGGIWYQIEKTKSLNNLKRRMVERGMSVEEIERVVKAGGDDQ